MAALPKVLSNHAHIKSAGGVALRVRTQDRRKRGMDQGLPDNIVLIHQVRTDGLFYLVNSKVVYPSANTVYVNPELTVGRQYQGDGLGLDVRSTDETAVANFFYWMEPGRRGPTAP